MNFIRPFFEGKSKIFQVLSLILLILMGSMIFSALSILTNQAIFHTSNMNEAANPAAFARISQSLTSVGIFLFPAMMFAFCQDKKWLHYNAADRRPHYLLLNVTLLLSIVLLPVVAALSGWNETLKLPDNMANIEAWMRKMESSAMQIQHIMTYEHSYGNLMANLFALAAIPALCEEFMFQGTIQRFMHKSNLNPHGAIWITAILFSTIHLQFYGFVPRLLLGAYLGYLYYWSRSLWLPILAHFLHNALCLMVDFTMQGRGIILEGMKISEVRGGTMMVVTCTLVAAMSMVFMWKVQRDLKQQDWD